MTIDRLSSRNKGVHVAWAVVARLATAIPVGLPATGAVSLPALVLTAETTAAQPKTRTSPATRPAPDTLPRPVQEMVDLILAAVREGRIEALADAVDWNEMKPDLASHPVPDPVAYWKSRSKAGDGRETLDVLDRLLAGKPAVVPLGRDLENNRLFVWPRFADTPLTALSPAETADLALLATPEALAAMRARNRYLGWRLVLGADGTWHTFRDAAD